MDVSAKSFVQEEIISPRILVFIDSQVYYHCRQSYYSELLTFPEKPLRGQGLSRGSMYQMILRSPQAAFDEFSAVLLYYTRRKLSFQNDVLRAAQGMLRKFSALSGHQCFEGLPAPLDRSLLFHSRSDVDDPIFGRREGFPSYSWTGWKSVPWYNGELETGLRISNDKHVRGISAELHSGLRGWIIWHCRTEKGKYYRITDTGRLRKSLFPKLEDSKSNARRDFQEIPTSASDVNFGSVRVGSYPLLHFWTICINLRLKKAPRQNRNPVLSVSPIEYRAIDKNGESCGVIYLDATIRRIREGKFALLAISNSSFWALMLRWKGGVAERCGVAELSTDIIDRCFPPGPRWKVVVLG